MLKVAFRVVNLQKRYPLAISRGIHAASENLFVTVSDGVHEGLGEHSPEAAAGWTAENGRQQLERILAERGTSFESPHTAWQEMHAAGVDPPAKAALDVALWDLLAKRAGMPLYRLLGLPRPTVPTSVTIGLNPPEITRERVPEIIRRTGARCLKIKLGSPQGRDFDRAHFSAAAEAAAPFHARLRVDANGGWTAREAIEMDRWLAERNVDYIEQPLAAGHEDELPGVFAARRLPIFADESCRVSSDVPRLADRVDGVNLKLMKCGGITEALRIVAAARAHGLGTMIGCMSESSVAIAAGASLGALFDHIDLDSHLNLAPDPAEGAEIVDGVILPGEVPGHGARLHA